MRDLEISLTTDFIEYRRKGWEEITERGTPLRF
jgi:hypothetical protein